MRALLKNELALSTLLRKNSYALPCQSFVPDSNHSPRTLLVSPLFLYHQGEGYDIPTINFAEGVTLTLETSCPTSELREVSATEVRFLPADSR